MSYCGMNKEIGECLLEAKTLINGERMKNYGEPGKNIQGISELWTTYLGAKIYPRDVCNMMILVKVSRDACVPKHDNQVDICGYSSIADSCFPDRK